MEIKRFTGLEGAKKAEGVVVIIDVFRAGNTILSCFQNGAKQMIPVDTLDKAYELKQNHPYYILAGERNSLPPEGFDFGNSPVEASGIDLRDQTVILTTSAGTQGIVNAGTPSSVFIGTFNNADSLVNRIKTMEPSIVSLVAMGFESNEEAEEDEWCAWYLNELLENRNPDFDVIKEHLMKSKGASRLQRIDKREDLEFCLKLNTINIIPEFDFHNKVLIQV
jgi:2-phosphosulfolactate phosphatase